MQNQIFPQVFVRLCEFVKRKHFWFVLGECACVAAQFQWGHGPGRWLTEMVSSRTLNTFQRADPTFCKIHTQATEQKYYHFTPLLFIMKTDRILCVSFSFWVTDSSSFRHLSSQAVQQNHHPTALVPTSWRSPDKPPGTLGCSIAGNMQRMESQVSGRPNKCRWRKKTWNDGQVEEAELTNQ